jgi:hypothetical protein
MGFTIEVPRKRERNSLVISQAKGEALKPQKMGDKKHKASKDRKAWKKEDWGD